MIRLLRCVAVGVLAVVVGVAQEQQTADSLRKAAEKGDTVALQQLRAKAEQGDASAQYSLGILCDNGEGVPKDKALAVAWYRKAAEQGYAQAQYDCVTYDNGDG